MPRHKLTRPGLVVAGLCAALLAAELGHRAWLRSQGRPHDRARVDAALMRAESTTAFFVPGATKEDPERKKRGQAGQFGILNPFFGSEHHHDTGEVLRFFREGVPDDAYVVVVLGGSVAANWSQDLNRAFASRLAADPRLAGRSVRVLQYAHAAYKQPQQATRLAYLLSFGYRPHAVINLDGFNELASSISNALGRTNPVYPSGPVWGAVLRDRKDLTTDAIDALIDYREARNAVASFVGSAKRWHLSRSSLAIRFAESRLQTLQARASDAQGRYWRATAGGETMDEPYLRQMHGPPYSNLPQEVFRLAVESWYEGSLSLQGMCAERGIYYLHCLQPALHDPGAKIVTAEEEAIGDGPRGWRDAIVRGYPMLRERGAELVRRGVAFEDVSLSFEDVAETLYFDPCHFHAPGNLILSEVIGERFLRHMPDPAPRAVAGPAPEER